MKTFNVDGTNGRYYVNLPQSVEEIGVDYLKTCTDYIQVAPNYAVVAIVYKDSLSFVLTASKKKTPTNIAVIPVFIKSGDCDSEFIKSLNIGDRIVISSSDLSIGHHINSPYNKITPNHVINVCDGDKDIYKEAIAVKEPVCFLEFKLVPISAIHAKLGETSAKYVDRFIGKVVD